MPANLTPEYLAAEARYKATRDPKKRIEALEEMLRVIPKHKGTDHLRGDLRKKLSQLKEELRTSGKKGGARRAMPGHVPSQGAGQVVMLGASNAGKSSLLAALTRAKPEVAAYPYTTRLPLPGMMMYEDVSIQLIDSPAMEPAAYEPWMNSLLRGADFGLLVLDPSAAGALGSIDEIAELAGRGRVKLVPAWWAVGQAEAESGENGEDAVGQVLDDDAILARLEPGDVELPVLVAVNKMDVAENRQECRALIELLGDRWPMLTVSANTGEGLDGLRQAVFRGLRVMRVYAKPPGKPPSTQEPIVLPIGATVKDMATTIHKDLGAKVRFARIWSKRHFQGQRIPSQEQLQDCDIVEINA